MTDSEFMALWAAHCVYSKSDCRADNGRYTVIATGVALRIEGGKGYMNDDLSVDLTPEQVNECIVKFRQHG